MKYRSFDEHLKQLPLEVQARIEARTQELQLEELTLRELRNALQRSQESLAQLLGVKQAEISKMERRTDMYLSTVRKYIEAMGGSLNLVASFPGHQPIRIKELSSLEVESGSVRGQVIDDNELLPFDPADYVDNPIALARIKAHLRQSELAQLLGVSRAYISKVEQQKTVSPRLLARVRAALKQRRKKAK